MRVLVAGSHGGIGQRLVRLLADRGDVPVAMIRDDSQSARLRELGGEPLVADLTGDVRDAPQGCEAIVFTAGAGPGSGPEPKQTVDRGGAQKLIEAARAHGVRRYVMVSSMGAGDPSQGSQQMRAYLEAKAQADEALRASDLDWTIVRPGRLTDDEGSGRVEVAEDLGHGGEIPRADVAAVLLACLARTDTVGRTFEVLGGDDRIDEALDGLVTS